MNDEIKEILDYYRNIVNEKKETYTIVSRDTIYLEKLLDYITNLQQENERLKEKSINEVLKNDFDMCVKDLKKAEKKIEKLEDYKTRIEKAVEYIEKNLLPSHSIEKTDWEFEDVIFSDLPVEVIKPLIDILNGRSDE